MVGWHHRLNGHGFGWTPGVGDGQGGLACCGSWGLKDSDTTEQLKRTYKRKQHGYVHSTVCEIGSQQEAAIQHRGLNSVLCDDLEGQDGGEGWETQEGVDICIHVADSHCFTAETSTTLESNYPCMLSGVRLFVTLWTIARQSPLSMRFPRQGSWSGLKFPTP